jgi:hypothetical protein
MLFMDSFVFADIRSFSLFMIHFGHVLIKGSQFGNNFIYAKHPCSQEPEEENDQYT